MAIPEQGRLPFRARGEVLLSLPWAWDNLAKALKRGVRWVHTIGTGVERLPLDLIEDRILTCSRGASSIPIAEWVFAVMLALEKDLPGSWINSSPATWEGGDLGGLHGQTLGIVGFGGIGQAVARLGLAFGMQVKAMRRSDAPSPVEGVEFASGIQELLAQSDHVLLALPLTPASRHILDADALAGPAGMQSGACPHSEAVVLGAIWAVKLRQGLTHIHALLHRWHGHGAFCCLRCIEKRASVNKR